MHTSLEVMSSQTGCRRAFSDQEYQRFFWPHAGADGIQPGIDGFRKPSVKGGKRIPKFRVDLRLTTIFVESGQRWSSRDNNQQAGVCNYDLDRQVIEWHSLDYDFLGAQNDVHT